MSPAQTARKTAKKKRPVARKRKDSRKRSEARRRRAPESIKKRSRREFGSVLRRKRNGRLSESWYIRFRAPADNGKTKVVWRCIGPDRDEAVERLAEVRAALIRERREGGAPVVLGNTTLPRFKATVIAHLKARQSPRTLATNLGRLNILADYFGDRRLRTILPSDVDDLVTWLAGRSFRSRQQGATTSGATINRFLSLLSVAFRLAVAKGVAKENPVKKDSRQKETKLDVPFYSREEVARIAAHGPGIRDVIVLAYETAARRGELLALDRRRDVDWGWGELGCIVIRNAKNGRSRRVPMTPLAAETIRARCERLGPVRARGDNPLFPEHQGPHRADRVSKLFRRAAEEAGFPGCRLHDMRHASLSAMAQLGIPLPTISAIAGHSSIAVTQRYACHLPQNAEQQAMAAFGAEGAPKKKRRSR